MKRAICICVLFFVVFLGLSTIAAAASEGVDKEFNTGKAHLKSGRYEQAIEVFSLVLTSLTPDERNAHVVQLARAQAYFGKGDASAAWKDLKTVLRSNQLDGETRATALQLSGMLSLRGKDQKKALSDFTEAIKTPHDNHSLLSASFANRGIAYINLGDPDRAVSDLDKAIELEPTSGFAYAGRSLAQLRRDNIEKARKDAEKALRLNPDPQTLSMAEKVLSELAVSASGPLNVSVPIGESGHSFVQVSFSKGGKPHRFLLDTGATYTVVDRKLLAEIGRETEVKAVGKGKVQTADGTAHTVIRYRIKDAFLFHLPLGEIEVHVFEKQMPKIINLLGIKSISRIAVSIDNAQKKVEFRRKDTDN
ncbi:MAG: tetratricopeptide repeat protein [Desulfomonile tiedjei]|nr:tetratricopeptide repeat protein [Desulfomonile tiedjei]